VTVRFGTLGAARITPAALIRPAAKSTQATVVSVAARDRDRASAFAQKHGIPKVLDDYEAVVSDPEIDAVYIPLPNSHHARWTLAALEAGKHVLCEKPFTANAAEAEEVALAAAARPDLVVMEAFHYLYHPLAARMREVVASGELGDLRQIDAWLCFPLPRFNDIRYQYDLAGGAMMDAGCYPVSLVRWLAGSEPEVVAARAKLRSPEVDRAMNASLRFPDGCTGTVLASMWSSTLVKVGARVVGSQGQMRVFNPQAPQIYHRLSVRANGSKRVEHLSRRPTYEYQLDAFCAAVEDGTPVLTPPPYSVANMRVIDAIYQAAGLPLRGAVGAV
jgi:predicted dehydrogenase